MEKIKKIVKKEIFLKKLIVKILDKTLENPCSDFIRNFLQCFSRILYEYILHKVHKQCRYTFQITVIIHLKYICDGILEEVPKETVALVMKHNKKRKPIKL